MDNNAVGSASIGNILPGGMLRPPPMQSAVGRIEEKLGAIINDLNGVENRLCGARDRALGQNPKTDGNTGAAARPVRSGRIGSIEDQIDTLHGLIARCGILLTEVETVI